MCELPADSRYTHSRLTALCPGLPRWAGTRKAKPIWILLKEETVSGSGISWAICKSASRSRQITMPVPHHSVFLQAAFLPPNQQYQSTEDMRASIWCYMQLSAVEVIGALNKTGIHTKWTWTKYIMDKITMLTCFSNSILVLFHLLYSVRQTKGMNFRLYAFLTLDIYWWIFHIH